MSAPFVAEIRMFGFNFAPTGWATCDGQLLPISQNTALFSLLGTFYGGDGRTTFALPDLQGSAPMAWGDGPGLSSRGIGETGGSDSVTLLIDQIGHPHTLRASSDDADLQIPTPTRSLAKSAGGSAYSTDPPGATTMSPSTIQLTGTSQPHNNMQPYLTVNFCIALQGVFPTRP